ncbi:hypothetical protein FRB99_000101 [Tulasnella sp. 403]|nr:hypothetical protein FRB99_000101 [Tulasnella sp. 403]
MLRKLAQARVFEATSDEPRGPFADQLNEIARMTYDPDKCGEIVTTLYERLRVKDPRKHWRQVGKALNVIHYCLHVGSVNVDMYFRDNIHVISVLRDFGPDSWNPDFRSIRKMANELTAIILDPSRLTAKVNRQSVADQEARQRQAAAMAAQEQLRQEQERREQERRLQEALQRSRSELTFKPAITRAESQPPRPPSANSMSTVSMVSGPSGTALSEDISNRSPAGSSAWAWPRPLPTPPNLEQSRQRQRQQLEAELLQLQLQQQQNQLRLTEQRLAQLDEENRAQQAVIQQMASRNVMLQMAAVDLDAPPPMYYRVANDSDPRVP